MIEDAESTVEQKYNLNNYSIQVGTEILLIPRQSDVSYCANGKFRHEGEGDQCCRNVSADHNILYL